MARAPLWSACIEKEREREKEALCPKGKPHRRVCDKKG